MDSKVDKILKRINWDREREVNFGALPELLKKFAQNVPFENISIMNGEDLDINYENLTEKIVSCERGGVCYELNPLLYYFLKELGFDVQLISATITGNGPLGLTGTHIAIILNHDRDQYLIDAGFGANLALQPIPFSGETVISPTGDYRIREEKCEFGEYILEKVTNGEIAASYSFFLDPVDDDYLNKVKRTITEHPHSPFNKSPLITQVTKEGHHVLTDKTYTNY